MRKESYLLRHRLYNQHLMNRKFASPLEVVKWFGAVQAQDYQPAIWGIGLRLDQPNIEKIEQAIEEREIVRTWPMRNTIHFVPARDASWMLKLLTPRASAKAAPVYRKAGLDDSIFSKSTDIVSKALEGGKRLTRKSLYERLEREGISTKDSRGVHIIGQLAYRGLICFGPHTGKQPAFVLPDEWVPESIQLENDQALAELAKRYFTSHGPATVYDFAWWAGLTMVDARKALQIINNELDHMSVEGEKYWFFPVSHSHIYLDDCSTVHLLPVYDEFTVAYKDRSLFLDLEYKAKTNHGISRVIVKEGKIIGMWNQTIKKKMVQITPILFQSIDSKTKRKIEETVQQYGDFLKLPVEIIG